jgi:hypothetical protein
MKKVFVVFSSDQWNNYHKFLGVYTTKKKCVKQIIAHSNNTLTGNDLYNLENLNQTQGRLNNYEIISRPLNQNL